MKGTVLCIDRIASGSIMVSSYLEASPDTISKENLHTKVPYLGMKLLLMASLPGHADAIILHR